MSKGSSFSVDERSDVTIITPACDLDLTTKPQLAACLEQAGKRTGVRVIVSMLQCKYADSTALNVLATARRSLDGRLALVVNPSSMIARVFAIANFGRVIPIFHSLADALSGKHTSH